jgi:two-component system response regulator HydG
MTSVLIVDDDPGFRTTIGRDLGEHGFAVSLAHSADDAIAVLAERAAERSIDVLLTDLRMPGGDGIDLLEKIRTVVRSSAARSACCASRSHRASCCRRSGRR